MGKTLLLIICKPGGTVNRIPVDTWAAKMRMAGYDVTVKDPDEMGRGGVEFGDVTIDEPTSAQKAGG